MIISKTKFTGMQLSIQALNDKVRSLQTMNDNQRRMIEDWLDHAQKDAIRIHALEAEKQKAVEDHESEVRELRSVIGMRESEIGEAKRLIGDLQVRNDRQSEMIKEYRDEQTIMRRDLNEKADTLELVQFELAQLKGQHDALLEMYCNQGKTIRTMMDEADAQKRELEDARKRWYAANSKVDELEVEKFNRRMAIPNMQRRIDFLESDLGRVRLLLNNEQELRNMTDRELKARCEDLLKQDELIRGLQDQVRQRDAKLAQAIDNNEESWTPVRVRDHDAAVYVCTQFADGGGPTPYGKAVIECLSKHFGEAK
jgi:chromosome segregation ATPase